MISFYSNLQGRKVIVKINFEAFKMFVLVNN